MSADFAEARRPVKRKGVLCLMTPAENLSAKIIDMNWKLGEIQDQIHNLTYMLKECVTLLRIARYGKQGRK